MEKAAINFTPGAVGRLCGVHVTWSNTDGFMGRKIRSGPNGTAYSYYELLWNWMTGATPGPAIATISSASYAVSGAVAPEAIVATANPWPTTLGEVQVTVTDAKGTARLAPLYFVSQGQLLYLIPAGTAAGLAQIAIGGQRITVEVEVEATAIYTAA